MDTFNFKRSTTSWHSTPIFGWIVGAITYILLFILIIIVAYINKKKINSWLNDILGYDKWEVDRKDVKFCSKLGEGAFGMVYEGELHNLKVAIKIVNTNAKTCDRNAFLNEVSIMKDFNSIHVVKLLGVVSKGEPVLLVMELMSNGDLNTYLRSRRPKTETYFMGPPPEIWKWAGEIADGMAYLSSIKCVHRDLAARNCMVSADLVVKIGDFGLTRNISAADYYKMSSNGLFSIRWWAPEALRDRIFTSCSDVWSYGVVIWEIATLAELPYAGLSDDQVLQYVGDKRFLYQPSGCSDQLYNLMSHCWKMDPRERPTFIKIIEALSPYLPLSFRANSFYAKIGGSFHFKSTNIF